MLLYAGAGSGKTTTAAEFARWYHLTGGVRGPVLFTSFERYTPLPRVLDKLGQMFEQGLARSGIQWLALDDGQRRSVALQLLQAVPVLWIWDNVEPVAGFPSGSDSAWSEAEQRELADFLRAARNTQAKLLLTSRRDERGWLGELPRRIAVPPMPYQERVQLARAIASKHGQRLAQVTAWRKLLIFTQSNPLTITVLVGQALRDGLTTEKQISKFVAQLRAGKANIDDVDEEQGRDRSLAASLSYGFEHTFSADERRILALLHLFQGFVDVDALVLMGREGKEWSLPHLDGLTRDDLIPLFDRAAEIGLLTALGGGYYRIHPALPWYFKTLFDEHYPNRGTPLPESGRKADSVPEGPGERAAPTRAFVKAMSTLGDYYHNQYGAGNRSVIAELEAEELNLLHARQLAREHGWYWRITSTMQGLHMLYDHTGRRAEWQRLVEEIVPLFMDPATNEPLPNREEQWSFVMQYRVLLAQEARQWAEAERLQRADVEWDRKRAATALAQPPAQLDGDQRNAIRTLAMSLGQMGQIQAEQNEASCVVSYEEAAELLGRIGDQAGEAVAAFNLGHAYKDLPALRDLAQAERWYTRSLELRAKEDEQGRGRCYAQLGSVAYERFNKARAAQQLEEELLRHLNDALRACHQALALLPANAVNDLAVTHNQLGLIYKNAGDLDRALPHYRESIRYHEGAGNLYAAAQTRCNVAIALAQSERLAEARAYAEAALRNFERFGVQAAGAVYEKAKRTLAAIEAAG